MSESQRRKCFFAVFYILDGVFYLVFSLWHTLINPLEFYRAPPGLESMAYAFLLVMFIAGVFFISRAYTLLKGWVRLSLTDLYASVFSLPLWFFPALISLGNARTYLTEPYIPEQLRSYGFYYLQIGVMFLAVGLINISSIIYLILLRLRKYRKS